MVSFSDQAVSLYRMMFERGADPMLLDEAERLCDFFGEAEERIEALLGLGPR